MTNSGMFETYRPVSLGIGYRGRLLPLVCASPERPSTGRLSMSAFGSEADALAHPSKSPLIARRRHGRTPWAALNGGEAAAIRAEDDIQRAPVPIGVKA